jgi:hypothetical protein
MRKKFAFHIAPIEKENKIMKEGLKTHGGRIYLTDTRENAYKWSKILSEDHNIDNFVLIEAEITGKDYIETPGDTTKYPREIIVEENIEPSKLIKIKELSEKDYINKN